MKTFLNIFFKVLGVLLCIAGVVGGLYMGVWYGLIGGVIATVEACKATPIESTGVAFGVARVLFAGVFGWLTAFGLWALGGMSFVYASTFKKAPYFRW